LMMIDAPSELRPLMEDYAAFTRENLLHLTSLLVSEATRYLFSQDGKIDFEPGMRRDRPRVILS